MTYSAEVLKENAEVNYLVVIKPRRQVSSDWTAVGGGVYSIPFTLGKVVVVEDKGVALTEVFTSSLAVSQFYYDWDNQLLYVRMADSSDPDSNHFVIATYEIYVGSVDVNWHRVPTDNTTEQVYFEPLIAKAPLINSSVSDSIFGVMPVTSTEINLINNGFFEKHVSDSSFNKAEVVIYRWIGRLIPGNIKQVFKAVGSNLNYTRNQLSIRLFDRLDILNKEFRHPGTAQSFYRDGLPDGDAAAVLDPNFATRPIRYVYGRVDGFVPVNLKYSEVISAFENSRWGSVYKTDAYTKNGVVTGASSTTTRTYLVDASGFSIGDNFQNLTTFEVGVVTNVDYGANFIEHAALTTATAGQFIQRPSIAKVDIFQGGVKYSSLMDGYTVGEDYGEIDLVDITLFGLFSFPVYVSPSDQMFFRVYGKQNDVTMGGSPFGSNDTETGNLTNGIVILFDILKKAGIAESEIDLQSFIDAEAAVETALSFSVPENAQDDFPTYRQIVEKICASMMLKVFINSDGKWEVARVQALVTSDNDVDDNQMINPLSYEFNYDEIVSDVVVEYRYQEIAPDAGKEGNYYLKADPNELNWIAKYLHKVEKQKSFQTYLLKFGEARGFASELLVMLRDRRGLAHVQLNKTFFETDLGQTVEITSEKLPGWEFVEGTENARKFSIVEINKTPDSVDLVLDDQKGFQAWSGFWET